MYVMGMLVCMGNDGCAQGYQACMVPSMHGVCALDAGGNSVCVCVLGTRVVYARCQPPSARRVSRAARWTRGVGSPGMRAPALLAWEDHLADRWAAEHPNQRDVPAELAALQALAERARAADLDHVVDAAAIC